MKTLSRRGVLTTIAASFAPLATPRSSAEGRPAMTQEDSMEITRAGSQPSGKGPADWFTGTVRIDPLFAAKPPARAAGASVTFEPGA